MAVVIGSRRSCTAVRNRVEQNTARLRHIDGLHQHEGAGVLDEAFGIAGRERDVGDDRIVRVLRIQLAGEMAAQGFVGGGGFALLNIQAGDAGIRSKGTQQRNGKNSTGHGGHYIALSGLLVSVHRMVAQSKGIRPKPIKTGV